MQHVDTEEFIIELPASYYECSYVITPSNPESTTEVTIDDHFSSLTYRDYQRLCTYVQVIYPTGKMLKYAILSLFFRGKVDRRCCRVARLLEISVKS